MKLPKELTTITPLSKYLALFLFVFLPILGFYLGTHFNKNKFQDKNKYINYTNPKVEDLIKNKQTSITDEEVKFGIYEPDIQSAESTNVKFLKSNSNKIDFLFTVTDYELCSDGSMGCPQREYDINLPNVVDNKFITDLEGNEKFLGESLVLQRDDVGIVATSYSQPYNDRFYRGTKVTRIEFFNTKTGEYFENNVRSRIESYRFLSIIGDSGYGYGGQATTQPICFNTQNYDLFLKHTAPASGITRIFKLPYEDPCIPTHFLMDPIKCGEEVIYEEISCLDQILDINEYQTYLESNTPN